MPRVQIVEEDSSAGPESRQRGITEERRPWDRRPSESNRAYQYFLSYRDAHPKDRSVHKIATLYGVQDPAMAALSLRHEWTIRTGAYLEHLARAKEDAHARAIARLEEDEVNLGRLMMQKSQDGITKRPLRKFSGAALTRLAEVGSDMRRRGLGVPADAGGGTNVQVNVQTNVISSLVAKLDKMDEDRKTTPLLIA